MTGGGAVGYSRAAACLYAGAEPEGGSLGGADGRVGEAGGGAAAAKNSGNAALSCGRVTAERTAFRSSSRNPLFSLAWA